MKKRIMRMALWIIGLYLLLLALLFTFQRTLMYPGTRSDMTPEQAGLEQVQNVMLRSKDDTAIQLWLHAAEPGEPFILYFHGNGGHLGWRADRLQAFIDAGFGIAMMSYRGYGKSEGHPSEQANYEDAAMALESVRDTLNVPLKQLILYGESLGTGVAIEIATRYDVGLIALEAPYTSVRDRAAEIYRLFPVRWLVRDAYDSLSKIRQVKAPLILFHGEQDKIIPIRHGKTLFAAASEPKEAHYFPDVAHEDFDSYGLARKLKEFAARHPRIIPDPKS